MGGVDNDSTTETVESSVVNITPGQSHNSTVVRNNIEENTVVKKDDKCGMPEMSSVQHQDVRTVLQGVMAVVTTEDSICNNVIDTGNSASEGRCKKGEDCFDQVGEKVEEGDDDDIDICSMSSGASEKTEVTNNKSTTGSCVINSSGGDKRGVPRKRESSEGGSLQNARRPHRVISQSDRYNIEQSKEIMQGSFSGLSIHIDNDNQQVKPRQAEPPNSSCDVLPFKGNPSKQRRVEKEEKKREKEKRRLSLQQQKHAVLANKRQEDEDFDLRSKPGYINVVLEDEDTGFMLGENEDRSYRTSQSRQSRRTSKSTTSSSTSSSSFYLTEERVLSHMKDYYEDYDSIFKYGKSSLECWEAFFRQYFTEDIMWVRSTGNPLRRDGLAKLMVEDIVGLSMSIVSIDNIQLLAGGLAAVVVFTADQEYVYRGKHESDRTVITSVLHVVNGCEILIGHEHRCVGKPIPKETRWES